MLYSEQTEIKSNAHSNRGLLVARSTGMIE